ncbi:MAG: penicillin-binding protein activator LpoB [Gracilimonas sp.]|uniref:penicillin-binding protein activator LpoB n=1 Tax=Gracilimonas sp. TaxID=1974203 RepID=UPI001B26BB6C|nr:penicillin-binding protein activator LpoB [Gracilimonas sp.]MBO6586642.1 penicillin-binding protein activator LpoB [Gracilimonas sp.]MBO6615299.1 penicillin-binding protein activator LpoB [Gracilimonas sp.]
MKYLALSLFICTLIVTGCGPSQQVSRVAADTQTDLSGRWNDTDARLVAEEMISDAVSMPWLSNFNQNHSDPPVTIVGNVRNETMEHIDTDVITKEMERAFVNSGRVQVVASQEERQQIRQERQEQQSFASYESTKALAQELGADFMLIGNISSIVDESLSGKDAAIFYSVNLELIDVETNRKVWIGNKKIKKLIERRKLRG